MYRRFYGLATRPFALTPDPEMLFRSRQHAQALTLLEYGLETHASFALLTGDIGSGKTTLLRHLVRNAGPQVALGLISNSHAGFGSIHPWLLSALSIAPADDSEIAMYEALVDSFVREYARGRRTLLIVDEAQNLPAPVLEELRLLSNVNSEKDIVLQVLLVGQPELRQTLARPDLRQLAQRISVDFHLRPLTREDTHAYVRHRLRAAGATSEIFLPAALEYVYEQTAGVPRLINQLCDLGLVYGYAEGLRSVDRPVLEAVLRDRGEVDALTLATAAGIGRVAPSPGVG